MTSLGKRAAPFVVLLVAASCGKSDSRQHVNFARLTFEVPDEWTHSERVFKGVSTCVWTPRENKAKESLTVIRSDRAAVSAQLDPATLSKLLENAQASLQNAKISPATPIVAGHGLPGIRLDVTYNPPGIQERYHRVHVLLVDGASLVHVLYTAREPDPHLEALQTVLATIHEGQG